MCGYSIEYQNAMECVFTQVISNGTLPEPVGNRAKMPIAWIQDPVLPSHRSIIGAINWGGIMIMQVITASKDRHGIIVDWCLAHELGHVELRHYKKDFFLHGPPSASLEKQADAFAIASLYLAKKLSREELWEIIEEHRGGGPATFGLIQDQF